MRPELETIATIEKYFLGVLSEGEILVFEMRMEADPNFKNDVELQTQLVQSLERISLQQSIQNAQKTYQFWKFMKTIGLIVIPVIIALSVWYFINASAESTIEAERIPTKVEQATPPKLNVVAKKEVVIDPDTIPRIKTKESIQKSTTSLLAESISTKPLEQIPSEFFTISADKDTIVETQSGIVFLIPRNAFVDANQNFINDPITLEITEAVHAETIMTAGLSTLHNGKPLETGGMFLIEATKNGQKLEIHPKKEITADIPTLHYKNDMHLFDGEVAADGTINWVNPKPLSKALIPQDILSLNFYPPNYLETLAKKGYDATHKQFTDSLYYSFSNVLETKDKTLKDWGVNDALNVGFTSDNLPLDVVRTRDTVKSKTRVQKTILGLNPLKVNAIWDERYQQTFIATKAFEARLQVIHENCREANYMLDVYLQNLDKDLYVSDSIIAYTTAGEAIHTKFWEFSKQRLTNVATISKEVSKLNDFYVSQQKVYRLALAKTQQKIDSMLSAEEKYQAFSKQQVQNLYLNELALTTQKVAKELNVKLPRVLNRQNSLQQSDTISFANIIQKEKRKRRYRASIQTTGWKNIDRIINEEVVASLQNRENTTIQNDTKTTAITYSDYELTIKNTEDFDQLFVYLVPKEFNSFIRLKSENGRFTYRLNDLLKYQLYCIGYVNKTPFYFEKPIRNVANKVQLRQISTKKLREKLAKLNTKNSMLETEISYHFLNQKNAKTVKKHFKIVRLKKELQPVVFPCTIANKNDTVDKIFTDVFTVQVGIVEDFTKKNIISFDRVEILPVFPGCETFEMKEERKQCFTDKVLAFLYREIDLGIIHKNQPVNSKQIIDVYFEIDYLGVVKNVKIRGNHPVSEAEVKRVIPLLPKMTPAMQGGKYVSVKYTIPLHFSTK
ncbi:hypothetical protein KORDIASMS9_04283 [Kordia sp. SMS9]|uniref:hypothetical protein n=1 Tax=Kordia sp. SMS9 TaxID=2282170 RepID=UPI000E0DFA59|nr:hypothetical protein [Kordia sp. SMS9]AXG72021.1 hypothetical protein KORDIASMS9_04283 [Kordia sp. SMS9]